MKRIIILGIAILLIASLQGQAQEVKSNLYILAVGVSKHDNEKNNKGVECSAKDARDFVDFFLDQADKQYGKVEVILLTDADAVMDKVKPALQWLQSKASAQDTVMFYYSGHGGPGRHGRYNVNLANFDGVLASSSLQVEPIREMLETAPGKRFMIFDSCFSASSTGIGFAKQQAKQTHGQGLVTIASSMSNESSHEDAAALKNGYFTAALLEALRGNADMNGDGIVTLAEMNLYLSDRVHQLTKGRQNTTTATPATLPSNLGMARTAKTVALAK